MLAIADVPPFSADLLMIDCPWSFDNWSVKGEKKNAKAHYACIPTDQLCRMPIGQMAAQDAWAWIWATHPMIDDAVRFTKAQGFKIVTSGVWVKRGASGKLGFGPGYVLRTASEPFILAKVGNPPTFSKSIRTVIEAPRREHSRKPDEAYRAAEQLFGPDARRLDIFSRQVREGWTAVGDQTDHFKAAA